MGRPLTLVLLCCVIFLVVADPLACPDGCSSSHPEQQGVTHRDISTDSACVWCLGVRFESSVRAVRVIPVVNDDLATMPAHPLFGSLQGIDHPPRA